LGPNRDRGCRRCRGCRRWYGGLSRTFREGEVPFIKVSSLRDNSLLDGGVVEFPSLVSLRVANKDTLLHMRVKAFPLVLLNVHIGSTPLASKMGHIRLPFMPQFIGSSSLDSISGAFIPNMD